jgi:hypothetical protein
MLESTIIDFEAFDEYLKLANLIAVRGEVRV